MLTEILFQSPIGILSILTLVGIAVFFAYVGYFIVHGMHQDDKK
ncbi:MAG: hypothetical protein ACQETK_02070 [Pseudomonadota bacterium]